MHQAVIEHAACHPYPDSNPANTRRPGTRIVTNPAATAYQRDDRRLQYRGRNRLSVDGQRQSANARTAKASRSASSITAPRLRTSSAPSAAARQACSERWGSVCEQTTLRDS